MVNTLNGNTLPPVGAVIENPITDRDKTVEVTVTNPQQMPFNKFTGPYAPSPPVFASPDNAMHSFQWT